MTADVLPHDDDAERILLGAVLVNNDQLGQVAERVGPNDWHRQRHRLIWRAMLDLDAAHEPIDLVTLTHRLRESGNLDKAGGAAYVASLVDGVPRALNAPHYADAVASAALAREVVKCASSAAERARKGDPAREVAEALEADVFRLLQRGSLGGYVGARAVGGAVADLLERVYVRKDRRQVGYGLADLDTFTGGIWPEEVIVIAARTGVGKSAFALHVAASVALGGGVVGYTSLEMAAESLGLRLFCSLVGVDTWKIRSGHASEWEQEQMVAAAAKVSPLALHIDESPAITLTQLRTRARRLATEHGGLALLVIDYLQLLTGDPRAESRQQAVSEISRGVKALARELRCPVLALSQLNRMAEQRSRPQLSDLRECLPADEWVSTPYGPAQMRNGPMVVTSLSATGVVSAEAMPVPKRYGKVCEVSTAFGTFRATPRHLVLTGTGWRQVRRLVPGRDVVAAPLRIPHANRGDLPHGRLLGWLLGNGGLSGTPSLIYRRELDGAVRQAVREFGVEVRPRARQVSANVVDAYLSADAAPAENPLMGWIRGLGIEGRTSHDKEVPASYLGSSDRTHAAILRGLWETDGTVTRGEAKISLANERLARQVAWLLLTIGVRSTVNLVPVRGKMTVPAYVVCAARIDAERMQAIVAGEPSDARRFGDLRSGDPRRVDPAPGIFVDLAAELGVERRFQHRVGGGRKQVCKEVMARLVAEVHGLASVAESPYMTAKGVGWGRVLSVRRLAGEVRLADLRVEGTHNFIAGGCVVHNSGSIEQDADVVLLLYRDRDKGGELEIDVAKNRNGPTGVVKVHFDTSTQRLGDLAREDR